MRKWGWMMGTAMTVHTSSPYTIMMMGMGYEWWRWRMMPKWWLMDKHLFGLIDFALLDEVSLFGGCLCFQTFGARFKFCECFLELQRPSKHQIDSLFLVLNRAILDFKRLLSIIIEAVRTTKEVIRQHADTRTAKAPLRQPVGRSGNTNYSK